MGIGIVIIFWAVVLGILSIPFAMLLFYVARYTGGKDRSKRVLKWILISAPLGAMYALGAFILYALWCHEYRGVDPGICDTWYVPLDEELELSFIDVPDKGSIHERGKGVGVSLLSDITHIGQVTNYIYGYIGENDAFILNKTNKVIAYVQKVRLSAALAEKGITEPIQPIGVYRFYVVQRWGWEDIIAAVIIGFLALVIFGGTLRRAWKGHQKSSPNKSPQPTASGGG